VIFFNFSTFSTVETFFRVPGEGIEKGE